MSGLRACPICTESLEEDLATSPSCGHVFHYTCLHQWLLQKESCPQCRAGCKKNKILRLYMPESSYDYDDDDDPVSTMTTEQIKNELRNTKGIVKLQDEALAHSKQETEELREESKAWKCQYDSLHKKYKIKETDYSCLHTQLKQLQGERDKMVQQLKETQQKVDELSSYQRMKEVLEEEPDEVDYLLRETHFNADELAKCLVATKKINRDLKASRENAKEEAKAMKRKALQARELLISEVVKSEALQKEVDSLKAEIEDLKRSRKASNHVVFTSSGSDSDVLTTPVTKRKKVDTEEEEETDVEDSHYSVHKPGKYDHLKVVASSVGVDLSFSLTSTSDRIKRHRPFTKQTDNAPLKVIPLPKQKENSEKMRFGYNGFGGKSTHLRTNHKPHQRKLNSFVPRKK